MNRVPARTRAPDGTPAAEAGRPADAPPGNPGDQVGALLDYVAGTSGAKVGGAVARVRLAAADTALALVGDTATAEVVTACVRAVKEAAAGYYGSDPAEPGAFDGVLQDMIARAEARDARRFHRGGRAGLGRRLPSSRAAAAPRAKGCAGQGIAGQGQQEADGSRTG